MKWQILISSFGLVFLAELGDKTQLAALAFSAQSQRPWSVFLGTSLALVCSSALAVGCGSLLAQFIVPKYLELGAAILFVVVGLVLLINMARRAPIEEQTKEPVGSEPGLVSRFVIQRVVPFEEELADFAAAQAEQVEDLSLRRELLAVAEAHRHHGESLGTIPCHDQDQLPVSMDRIQDDVARAEAELGEDDPVALVIRKQEAAAEFYIALASLVKIHAARDTLRDLAAEEIALSQRLCNVANHHPEDRATS
jgi:hypothetical protein